jgi:hypothetical protein
LSLFACFAFGVIFTLNYNHPLDALLFEQMGRRPERGSGAGDGEAVDLRRPVAVRSWLPGLPRRLWAFRQPIRGKQKGSGNMKAILGSVSSGKAKEMFS